MLRPRFIPRSLTLLGLLEFVQGKRVARTVRAKGIEPLNGGIHPTGRTSFCAQSGLLRSEGEHVFAVASMGGGAAHDAGD